MITSALGRPRDMRTASVSLEPLRLMPTPSSVTAFRAMLVFTFVMLLAPQVTFPALTTVRPALLSAAVAIGAYVLHRLVRRERVVQLTPALALSAALLWWTVLTLPMSYWLGGSVELLVSLYSKTLLIFWVLCHVVDTPRRLKVLALWLTVLAVPLAVTGIRQFIGGQFLQTGQQRIAGYESALTNNPNDLALMLNMLLPLALALCLHARSLGWRIVLGLIVLLQVAGVVLTFSRSGFVTLAVIAVLQVYRLARTGHATFAAIILVVGALALPLLPSGYQERLATIVDTSADTTGSAQARLEDISAAATYIAQNPIVGAGLGMDAIALNQARGATWTQVHNVYLQYGVDLGLPGMLLFVLLLASVIVSASRAREAAIAKGRDDIAAIADGIWISLVAFAVAAFFYPVGYHFYFYYFAGLAVGARHVCQEALLPRPQLLSPAARAA